MNAHVYITKFFHYEIEVPDDSEESQDFAANTAEDFFREEMRSPIADTTYDEIEVII